MLSKKDFEIADLGDPLFVRQSLGLYPLLQPNTLGYILVLQFVVIISDEV